MLEDARLLGAQYELDSCRESAHELRSYPDTAEHLLVVSTRCIHSEILQGIVMEADDVTDGAAL